MMIIMEVNVSPAITVLRDHLSKSPALLECIVMSQVKLISSKSVESRASN